MSLARSALRELEALTDVFARRPSLPDISLCRQQADARPLLDSADAPPAKAVLEALRRELSLACATEGGAANLPTRTLRMAPLVLWNGEPQPASFSGLLDTFLRAAQKRPRWLRDLIEAWLRDFGSDRILLREAGFAIAGLLAETNHPRLTAWRYAHESLSLFDAREGPRRVAHALLHGSDDLATVLSQIGMDDQLRANGSFFRSAVAEIVGALPKTLRMPSGGEAWSRASQLLEVKQTRRNPFGQPIEVPALRFAELAGKTAQGCLDPWLLGDSTGSISQEEIKAFLLRVMGDPRVEPARWTTVGEEATGLMRTWLAKASLEAFFSLITNNRDAEQWRARRKFWRACLTKMPSTEIWIVLGPGLASIAGSLRDLAGGYGRMDGSEANGQAVLLMKMGDLILSEWSNVGSLRAWNVGTSGSPKLYQRNYDARQLKAPSLTFPHQTRGDYRGMRHGGSWQIRAAALLSSRLQLHLSPRDYM